MTALQVDRGEPGRRRTRGRPPGCRRVCRSTPAGRISGTPTTPGTYASVRVTVTDAATGRPRRTRSPGRISRARHRSRGRFAQTFRRRGRRDRRAGDGDRWHRAVYLDRRSTCRAGLTMNSAGRITGTLDRGTRWLTTVTVTDSAGRAAAVTFPWSGRLHGRLTHHRHRPATGPTRVGQNVTHHRELAGGSSGATHLGGDRAAARHDDEHQQRQRHRHSSTRRVPTPSRSPSGDGRRAPPRSCSVWTVT